MIKKIMLMGTLNNCFFPYSKRIKAVISLVFAHKGSFKNIVFQTALMTIVSILPSVQSHAGNNALKVMSVDTSSGLIVLAGRSSLSLRENDHVYINIEKNSFIEAVVVRSPINVVRCRPAGETGKTSLDRIREGQSVYVLVPEKNTLSKTRKKKSHAMREDMIINHLNGHGYFITKRGTWFEAEKDAVDAGGHLVTIKNREEEDWLRDKFGVMNSYWIGYIRRGESWEWISGSKSLFNHWSTKQPDNYKGREFVAHMNYNGGWNDESPEMDYLGIAEIDLND